VKSWYFSFFYRILLLSVTLLAAACAPEPIRQPPAVPITPMPNAAPLPESETAASTARPGQPLGSRADVQAFIREMVSKYGFNAAQLQTVFRQAYAQPSIIAAMSKPAEAKPWYAYRSIFVNPKRIQGGVAFWRANAAALAEAERTYGVPPEFVVAIIGVETQYGANMGKYRVLEALATLAFDYPRRAAYFRKELESFLVMTRAEGINPLTPRGSYAGAMGFGQFMPSSFQNYAVDFDSDGHRDLWRDPRDAVGSVANYFKKNGWRTGEPVATPARVEGSQYRQLISSQLRPPKDSIASLRGQGIVPLEPVNGSQAAMLLEYEGRDGPEYWLGFDNFYVITRYNRSQMYALAVYQLSQAIAAQYSGSAWIGERQPERLARVD